MNDRTELLAEADKYVTAYPANYDLEKRLAAALRAEQKRAEDQWQNAMNLLAVIHRDGGHYAGKHGFKQTCIDAEAIVLADRTARDVAQQRADRYRATLVKVFDLGHNDECLFCGFKDNAVRAALAERPDEEARS